MNTPAHLLIGAAVMGRKSTRPVVWAAIAGALLPDLSLYLLAGSALYIFGIAPQVVFDELYFSHNWQTIFAIDNSFLIWGGLFAVALWRGAPWAIALTGAALLHLCFDFPLHHDDGRAHFWPLTGWVFESPLSYWDRDHGAMWLAPVEAVAASLAAITLWQRRFGWGLLVLITLLLLAEIWIVRQWLFFFTGS
ncbi:cobalamin biosynthesis protein CobQ [uncultured Roseobacter sp.]|uniref:cobalamin biosynthesis protein CobQ n=1 Tax=uncultured Roseobacter sp. TaxID=114847 RepID=UPI0026062D3E|nr:cobalamin biosynthesis protein CobQ [uncultured Roseobacter sp.]